jgi:radical SAM superfamily enzyme YgiQ (UPF0313 family)
MEKVDCLFLHVPKLKNDCRPVDRFIWINFLPMGLLGLADLLHREKISTQVIHLGVEWVENPHYSVLDEIREKSPRIIALDLHWHHQVFDVIEMVKQLKTAFPLTYFLLGGFTASFFHEEILRNFDAVDGVIRGEAEVPLLELAKAILQGKEEFFSIPNLSWRNKGRVFINPISYAASEEDLNRLSFNNFPLLKHYETYIRYIGQPFYGTEVSKEKKFWRHSLKSPIYPLTVGRGCPVQCTWCSGNIPSQSRITGRKEVTFRGVEQVLQSIREAKDLGYETLHICFDPYPHQPDYYLRLLSLLRQEKIRMECFFESFGLPPLPFIRAFKETFPGPKSLIALSPDVGSERLRRIHKGHPYTNQALMKCLEQLRESGVFCDVFFTFGVPFEKEEDLQETIELQKRIRQQYPNVKGIGTFTIEMEPGSPWHLDPEAFGVKTSLRNFMDFYHYHSGEENAFSSLGYWIPDYFLGVEDEADFEKTLQKIKYRRFCFVHPNARTLSSRFWGRTRCGLSSLFWKTKHLYNRGTP